MGCDRRRLQRANEALESLRRAGGNGEHVCNDVAHTPHSWSLDRCGGRSRREFDIEEDDLMGYVTLHPGLINLVSASFKMVRATVLTFEG